MASEYLKYLNRDVTPESPPPELSPKEKRKNWWYYNWKTVLVIAVIVIAAISMILKNLGITEPLPDYQVAYVGTHELSDETVEAITDTLKEYGSDASGDGEITVVINQYVMYEDTQDYDSMQLTQSAITALEADIMDQTSYFFLLEDPAMFTNSYQALADENGDLPPEDDLTWEDKVYPLSQFVGPLPEEDAKLYFGRRGFFDRDNAVKYLKSCDQLWNALLAHLNP